MSVFASVMLIPPFIRHRASSGRVVAAVTGIVLAVVATLVGFGAIRLALPWGVGSANGTNERVAMSSTAWVAPPPTWKHNSTYSDDHNAAQARLWNEVRLLRHWGLAESDFVTHCLADAPTFVGSNWDLADLSQNERFNRYSAASAIFTEHMQLGGTAEAAGLHTIKSILEEGLVSPVAFVRGAAVAGLVGVDCLGDAKLRERIASMETTDSDSYVRSVVRVQLDNLAALQKRKAGPR